MLIFRVSARALREPTGAAALLREEQVEKARGDLLSRKDFPGSKNLK